jgi:hypothetical protein
VLLVGTPEELVLEGDRVKIPQNGVLQDHVLADSFRWAHVQEDAGARTARILSPRRLQPQQEHIVVLVPAFDEKGAFAWDIPAGRNPGTLPVFYSWRFWTAEAGDFETLAYAIMPVTPQQVPGLGRAPLAYRRGDLAIELEVRGAITNLGDDLDGVAEAAARVKQQAVGVSAICLFPMTCE